MAAVLVLPCMTFLGHNIGFPCGIQSKVWQGISCFALVHSHLCSLQTLYKAISLHPDPRIKTLSGWVKVTKVTETWECCSFELWMIRGTRPELPSLDAAVSPRQGDDGYIVDPPYHSSERSWPIFKYVQIVYALSPRDPDCSHWPLICQDLLMDPWTLYKAMSLHPDHRTLSGWVKVAKVTEI